MISNDPAASRRMNISDAIREMAPTAILVRVYPKRQGVTLLFESDFYQMLIDHQVEERVACLIRQEFGAAADWRRAHDFYLPSGALYLTPEPYQNGYVPEDDRSFGIALARRIAISDGTE
ncbi:hypothetical protein G3I19_00195 [Streptomyces sp. SID10853]|uniref:hypothetical protein n=1 Tax=Streptomyces sp. SID10853 TaxID=2706028 RepID=UPI0013C12CD5|nr:hypothetical protein [Streptomyces sp. SID10853]NDZ76965.1 hypothetical protein [Streptomyces sp. SID10853]